MTSLKAPWLASSCLQHLFTLFDAEGAILRLVGGSVRDGLLGLPVSDIDLAVDRPPQWVMELLKKHHIKVFPTGIEHGTVTAVVDKKPYQITTLRVDVKTFGRRAHVAFTDDWVQDALRRDFTMNAIYADKDGQLFDPVGGISDLQKQRVQFIGNASQRIQEDYLRILRFFRFSARFGQEPYDAEGLEACKAYASHLPQLARERVTDEFMKLLGLPSPLYALDRMNETKVLNYILHPETWEDLKALVALEKELARTSPPVEEDKNIEPSSHPLIKDTVIQKTEKRLDYGVASPSHGNNPAEPRVPLHALSPLIRLAAFHPSLDEIKTHLRLSKHQESYLAFLIRSHDLITSESFKHQAYRWSKEKVFDLALLQTAHRISSTHLSLDQGCLLLTNLHTHFEAWMIPSFPLTGADVLSQGIKEGSKIGALLKAVETWWIEQDFVPDRASCLDHLSSLL